MLRSRRLHSVLGIGSDVSVTMSPTKTGERPERCQVHGSGSVDSAKQSSRPFAAANFDRATSFGRSILRLAQLATKRASRTARDAVQQLHLRRRKFVGQVDGSFDEGLPP